MRRAAKRALYRLAQRGVAPAAPLPPAPVVQRRARAPCAPGSRGSTAAARERRGSCSRAPYGGGALCSLILNDMVGITEVAGGEITKRRLEAELASLRATQKLPWVEIDPARAVGLVAEGLQLHRERGTSPPSEFGRWQPFFGEVLTPAAPPLEPVADPALAGPLGGAARAPRAGGVVPRPRDGPERCAGCSRRRVRAASWCPIRSRPSVRRQSWRASSSASSRPRRGAAGRGGSRRWPGSSARPTGRNRRRWRRPPPRPSPRARPHRFVIRSPGRWRSARSSWPERSPPGGSGLPT